MNRHVREEMDPRRWQARPRYEANPSLSSCLAAIGAFLFLVAFAVGLLVVGPLVGLAIAGGR